jgi:hypothetical protein
MEQREKISFSSPAPLASGILHLRFYQIVY